MFKETADIQTADMLKLPVPEAHYHSVVLKPSETQKEMVVGLSERAERVRNKMVDSSVDNMLLITNDGRKLALDQRLMNDILPDSETSKVGACAENVFDIWQRTADRKSTQMALEEYDLSDKQCKALLKSPSPLADVFKDFEKRETDHMDNIRDTIECRANAVIRADFLRDRREAR